MNTNTKSTGAVPETPFRLMVADVGLVESPFKVRQLGIADDAEMRDISDEEVIALALLIHNAYQEWKQQ